VKQKFEWIIWNKLLLSNYDPHINQSKVKKNKYPMLMLISLEKSVLDNLILQMNLKFARSVCSQFHIQKYLKRISKERWPMWRYENSKRELTHNLSFSFNRTNHVPETYENKEILINYVMNEMQWNRKKSTLTMFLYKI